MPPKAGTKRKPPKAKGLQPHKRARKDKLPPSVRDNGDDHDLEDVDEDDLCPICHLLFYHPVTTQCKHLLCESCMKHWAEASNTPFMTIVSLDDDASTTTTDPPLSANCPMCRTLTTATFNTKLHRALKSKYPESYSARETEEQPTDTSSSVQTLTLYVGNTHRLVNRHPDEDYATSAIHEWSFFVRPTSHAHVIEEVQIFLHPSFRPSRIIRSLPPFEIRRTGWGVFTVTAHVILKAGYSWASGEVVRAPDGTERGMLVLRWGLDFEGRGRQGRCQVKVKGEAWAEGQAEEEERETIRERDRMRRAYERDGGWVPPVEE